MTGLLGPRVRLGPVALLFHQRPEALGVHVQALLGGHLDGQVDRETVGVVQLERLVPGQLRAALGLHVLHGHVEDRRTGGEGAAERLLLGVGDLADPAEVGLQLRVRLLHLLQADRQQLDQARVLVAQQAHRTDRAAQQPAQDVPALLVARGDAVADQHQRTADVVGDHPEPDVVDLVHAVLAAGQLGGLLDHREDLVDLVHVVDALQQVRDALEAETGVDVLLRQLAEDRVALLAATLTADVLHEDQVPELQVAVARLPVPVGAELAGRGRSGSPSTGRTGRGCPSTRSCPSSRAARSGRRAGRRPASRCRSPRRPRSTPRRRAWTRRSRSRRRPADLVTSSQANWTASSLK